MNSPIMIRRVRGASMEPSLTHGQLIVAIRRSRPKPNQIVIVLHDGKEKVKRISEVDGAHVFLLGDNPDQSKDSRQFGLVLSNSILGTVLWPRRKTPKLNQPID